ncbi:MAG: DUF1572 family protein [Phycisphaerae bacterium]|nr:DUF1572 family protein [Phycisphaerae bacterium]
MSDAPCIAAVIATFAAHKSFAERAIMQLPDQALRTPLDTNTNSIAVIMKHIAGSLRSRWTDVLTTDGEKPWRDRNGEFVDTYAPRDELMQDWASGWTVLYDSLEAITEVDLARTVTVRGEPHTLLLALERSLGHTCYHVGQIVLIARVLVDHARSKGASRRAVEAKRALSSVTEAAFAKNLDGIPALDHALERLEGVEVSAAQIVRLRFEWVFGRAWLLDALQDEPSDERNEEGAP